MRRLFFQIPELRFMEDANRADAITQEAMNRLDRNWTYRIAVKLVGILGMIMYVSVMVYIERTTGHDKPMFNLALAAFCVFVFWQVVYWTRRRQIRQHVREILYSEPDYCPSCGYCIRGVDSESCPECGSKRALS